MSRLVESDVRDLPLGLEEYDSHLRAICGEGLSGVAMNASRKSVSAKGVRVSVVPVTAGLGIIGGFCDAVAGILRFLGADTAVTPTTDVRGVFDAVVSGCDVFFIADDDTFISVNPKKRLASDNSEATGRGFATALDLASGGIVGRDALVLGAGPVGRSATAELVKRSAKVSVYDLLPERATALAVEQPGVSAAADLSEALRIIPFVLDATPAADFLNAGMLRDDTVIAAPGVPLAISPESRRQLRDRLIHDVLHIGVATMLHDVL